MKKLAILFCAMTLAASPALAGGIKAGKAKLDTIGARANGAIPNKLEGPIEVEVVDASKLEALGAKGLKAGAKLKISPNGDALKIEWSDATGHHDGVLSFNDKGAAALKINPPAEPAPAAASSAAPASAPASAAAPASK